MGPCKGIWYGNPVMAQHKVRISLAVLAVSVGIKSICLLYPLHSKYFIDLHLIFH